MFTVQAGNKTAPADPSGLIPEDPHFSTSRDPQHGRRVPSVDRHFDGVLTPDQGHRSPRVDIRVCIRHTQLLITDHNAREIFSIVDRSYLIQEGRVMMSGSVNELLEKGKLKTLPYSRVSTTFLAISILL